MYVKFASRNKITNQRDNYNISTLALQYDVGVVSHDMSMKLGNTVKCGLDNHLVKLMTQMAPERNVNPPT